MTRAHILSVKLLLVLTVIVTSGNAYAACRYEKLNADNTPHMTGCPVDAVEHATLLLQCQKLGWEEPKDAARQAEIDKALKLLPCEALTDKVIAISKKYHTRPDVLEALSAASNALSPDVTLCSVEGTDCVNHCRAAAPYDYSDFPFLVELDAGATPTFYNCPKDITEIMPRYIRCAYWEGHLKMALEMPEQFTAAEQASSREANTRLRCATALDDGEVLRKKYHGDKALRKFLENFPYQIN